MKRTLIKNIGMLAGILPADKPCLCGEEMAHVETMRDAWLLVEDGKIKDFGTNGDGPTVRSAAVVDAEGGTVLPSFCDSHTHLVYADSREQEFVDKIQGLSYAEIARRGGGILNSADRLHELSEDELYRQAMRRVREVIYKGTGAIEIKSGYGLNTEDELKMLRVIRRIRETSPVTVRSTFLGAHAVGRAYSGRQSDYVDLVVREMIPEVGRQGLADFVDVFCDEGFFTPDETARILEAAAEYGMRPKIHGQELADSGGVEVAVAHGALSVDHLESMTERDIDLLRQSDSGPSSTNSVSQTKNYELCTMNSELRTIPTALPGTSFFLNMPFAPARKMIAAGLPLATASDYNPGSTPSGDMKFVVSLACIKMRLLPEEAINAATINTAAAMGLGRTHGSITRGKVANLIITEPIPSLAYIPYAYTQPIISRVVLNGEVVKNAG
ncbi:MAG: imidazolonepropionase [Prevotella sp.]|nr:imidazolonepropionase [Prevotella sp.]